jgi:tetratricopeptide (TPR) repeat protein
VSRPVFISYARIASAAEAQALADKLGDLEFLDADNIDDGDHFPRRLLDAVLDAHLVIIFATKSYSERRFCQLEMRLALAGCNTAAIQIVLALGEGSNSVLDEMPAAVADQSWPGATEPERLDALVRQRLRIARTPIREGLVMEEARKLAAAFLDQSKVPEPRALHGIVCSLPVGVAEQSIGTRFVGRADDLRNIHRILSEGSAGAARLTSRVAAAGGFGKTRLAVEYLHRYGTRYYPGGVFWVNAASKSLEAEFWRVLNALEPTVPDLTTMRAQGRDIRRELERALRGIGRQALYVVDDIPEASPGEDPPEIGEFCPALGAVTVLATSRQDTREASVRTIPVDTLALAASILLLTENVPGAGALSWNEWGRIAEWVGRLPLALDLLNRSLVLSSISPSDLLQRAGAIQPRCGTQPSVTKELDRMREALRGHVPRGAVRGITEAFSISFEKLDALAREVAVLLAQLSSAPIPEAFLQALPDEWRSPGVRVALRSRHFVTSGGGLSFGVMHRLIADFLRRGGADLEPDLIVSACRFLVQIMTVDRCQNPQYWPVMNLCRPHAEELFTRGVNCDATVMLSSKAGLLTAVLASAQGDYAGARRLGERVLEVRTRVLSEEHPDTLTSMNNLALTLGAQGNYAGARQLQERVLELSKRTLGEEHPATLNSMNNLATTLSAQGDRAGARRLQERVLEGVMRGLGENHPNSLRSMNNLATMLFHQGDRTEARQLQERVLEVSKRTLGENHPDTLNLMNNLAVTLAAQEDRAGAQRLQERVLEGMIRVLGEEHPKTLTSMNNLASTLGAQGDYAGARRFQEQVLEVRMRVLGEEHPDTLTVMNNLASTYRAQGSYAEARQLQERVLEGMTRVLGEEHPNTLRSMWILGLILLKEKDDIAPGLLRKCFVSHRKVLGEQHPDTIALAELLLQFETEPKSDKARK